MSAPSDNQQATAGKAAYGDETDEQSGRWLISYADLITTLMVLFLALYVLQLARSRELELRSVEKQAASQTAQGTRAGAESTAARQRMLALLEPLRAKHEISIASLPQGVEVTINAKILFNSGEAHLLPESMDVLDQVAAVLRDPLTANIIVEGHTDSVPISTSKYESNWELSSARAGAVVRFLMDKGVGAHRMAAVGRADNVPLVLGEQAAARAANRRVTILVEP
ncbi:motility protein B [Burkholderia glumae]|uniref:OmpA/MotB family protein n=1 Tax=Burkholderia glumae TaxID=337 RepID=UPI000F5ECE2B|nr:OmpA family protein [Burkholderia glumae]MCM2551965.1 OmpA family protein [Burkholderia glumae]MCQ0033030.1 OmpA family protein [Burkholderia glumae]MCQ0039102.1 OmpA family protein [Burkholderia glumae]NVE25066.1 OmpA family protein [Burkholderia glumae]QGA41113.1 OmpA family protein [Burkholderia glumae]